MTSTTVPLAGCQEIAIEKIAINKLPEQEFVT
jgi:hypothetical protein